MAADDTSWLEDVVQDSVLADVVRIQAWVRGYLVRKQMKEICQLYEDIVHDLDGLDMKVVWSHDYVSCPRVRKVKKVDLKVIEHCMSQETCSRSSSQRLVPSGSVRSETKIQGEASLVSVSTSTQVPHQTSFTVHSHGTGADQCKQITERENDVQMTARRLPVMGTNVTCSSTQTQECDFCVPQTQDMFGQCGTVMSQTSDVTQHGQVADHVNKTKGLFCQQLPSQDQICPPESATSQGQVCPPASATSQGQVCPPASATLQGQVCPPASATSQGQVCPPASATSQGQVCPPASATSQGQVCPPASATSQGQVCPPASATSQGQICPPESATSQGQVCPPASARSHADSVWVTSLDGRSSAEVTADKLVDDRVENNGSAETLQPDKLPADVAQPHQHFEKPYRSFHTVSHQLASLEPQAGEKPCCHTVYHQLASLKPQAGEKSPGQVMREASGVVESVELPADRQKLLQMNNSIAMELLWVQQAISSRKHYLRLKEQLQ